MTPRVMLLSLTLIALTSCSLFWSTAVKDGEEIIEDPVIRKDTKEIGLEIIKEVF